MPVDPWATTTAQEFKAQEPDKLRNLWQIIAAQKRETFAGMQNVLARISDVYDDLHAKDLQLDAQQAALAAQVAFLSGQSFEYASTKDWVLWTNTSGIGAWELLAYDSTYDDEYTFQASSTGVLKIEISANVLLNNGSATAWGATSRGYSLSWSGGSLAWAAQRSARISGMNCGMISVATSVTNIVTVPGNATVTLRTCRARYSPVAPDTTWHETRETSVVVTRVGI